MSPSDTMADHVAKVELLVQQLENVGEKVSESSVMAKLLYSLPQKYVTLRTAWDSVATESKKKENLVSRLLKEEKLLDGAAPNSVEAFAAGKSKDAGQQYKDKNSKMRFKCHFCHERGHFKKDCKKYHLWKAEHEKADGDKGKRAPGHKGAFVAYDALPCESENSQWLADSGATHHMTNRKELFTSNAFVEMNSQVRLGDNKSIAVR